MRRLIFTLLYDTGNFMLSRNFRLQKVGAIDWLFDNYDFARVSRGLDELMVLDVSRGGKIRVVAVLPPQPTVIKADGATALGLPACAVGSPTTSSRCRPTSRSVVTACST